MIHQDYLYTLIKTKKWSDFLNIYNRESEIINTDTILKQTTIIFEIEFFNHLNSNELEENQEKILLDTIYQLNKTKGLYLTEKSYKTLILRLVKISSPNEAYNYARIFPTEEICISCITQHEENIEITAKLKAGNAYDQDIIFTRIFNLIFKMIKEKGSPTYLSLAQFIDIVKVFDSSFPNYTQYRRVRKENNLDFGRYDCFHEILLRLQPNIRLKVIERILEINRPYYTQQVHEIERQLGIENHHKPKNQKKSPPKVFISYSWDDTEHKLWVKNLAEQLRANGVDVIFDQYELSPGKNLTNFIENNISKAKRIIIIFTPNYKAKADKRKGGVGYEYSIMNIDLYHNQIKNKKIIPILRKGAQRSSIPTFMQQYIHLDMTDNKLFDQKLEELLREIHNSRKIQKPFIGSPPNFA